METWTKHSMYLRPESALSDSKEFVPGFVFWRIIMMDYPIKHVVLKGPTKYRDWHEGEHSTDDNDWFNTIWVWCRREYLNHRGDAVHHAEWDSVRDMQLDGATYNNNYCFRTLEDAEAAIKDRQLDPENLLNKLDAKV